MTKYWVLWILKWFKDELLLGTDYELKVISKFSIIILFPRD